MSLLNVGNLSKYYGAELIFTNVSFQAARGDKIALVGLNGAGKSTLMKIIAGIESATSGGIHLARGTRLAYLAQEAHFGGARTLLEEMHASLEHLNVIKAEMTELEHALAHTDAPEWEARMQRYGEISHRYEHAGGYDIDHRIERILHGLGFREEHMHQPVAQFSGGQKTRAALAATLLSDPDLLLLDEPTNHLDLDALEWLEQFLKSWDGSLLVISHDRYFLDKVTNRTLEIAFHRLDGDYPAAYEKYLELKAERLELQLKMYRAQQEEIARTEDFIRRFKNSTLSKQARGRERRLERLKSGADHHVQLIDRPQQHKKMAINMSTKLRSGDLALSLEDLAVGYVVQQAADVELLFVEARDIQRGQRVALMGPNGSGKTSLLRTIVGELPPLRGRARLGHRVVLNYYAQAHEGLTERNTVIEEIRRIQPTIKEVEARNLLGRFLFSGDDIYKQVSDLSGGERSRVALAQLTLLGGNLLVLDEPTNHLDIDAREALETVLNEYNGTILFVSHDRYFIDAVADTLWIVEDGGITQFRGNYSEYIEERNRAKDALVTPATNAKPESHREAHALPHIDARPSQKVAVSKAAPATKSSPKASSEQARAVDRDAEREQRKRQRRLAMIEEEIAMLEQDLKELEQEITEASARNDVPRVTSLGMQYADLQDMLATRYDEWAAVAS